MRSIGFIVTAFVFALWVLDAAAAADQDFPSKAIRIVTGGVGGNSDFSARVISQGLSPEVGKPVIVENRSGAAIVSGQVVQRALPDGYTLLLAGSTFTIGDLI